MAEWYDYVMTIDLTPAQIKRMATCGFVGGTSNAAEWLVQQAENAHRRDTMIGLLHWMIKDNFGAASWALVSQDAATAPAG